MSYFFFFFFWPSKRGKGTFLHSISIPAPSFRYTKRVHRIDVFYEKNLRMLISLEDFSAEVSASSDHLTAV